MSEARLRIFAGPNGSGKSTIFDSFSKKYNSDIFLNADLIENIAKIADKHFSLKVEPTELPNWFIEYVLKYYV